MTESETTTDREPVTIQDRRRIDPETGTVRPSSEVDPPEEPDAQAPLGEGDQDDSKIAELTEDLQRVHAEFANYRKRTERDRISVMDAAKASIISALLPVIDDLGRARGHGDLDSSPLKSVADKLQQVFDDQGVTAFGAEGDLFDPQLHEAVQHTGDGNVSRISAVYRQGYTYGERVLRTAMVVVEDADDISTDNDDVAVSVETQDTAQEL